MRKLLRELAPGYRLHRADLPGKPDIVYGRRKLAIFVHGCFWHGHDCAARRARAASDNAEYWQAKIARNRARDARTLEALAGARLAHGRHPRMRAERPSTALRATLARRACAGAGAALA